jgi:hypothetical protein
MIFAPFLSNPDTNKDFSLFFIPKEINRLSKKAGRAKQAVRNLLSSFCLFIGHPYQAKAPGNGQMIGLRWVIKLHRK